jgi:beta-galactosidase
MGRVNYGGQLHDRKGFTKAVLKGAKRATTNLTDWTFSALSLESTPPSNLHWKNEAVKGPAFWRGKFKAVANKDTWLDVRGWSKGVLWVNGHNLGRFWNVGPTQTMFLPGCWLKDGDNDVVILDFIGPTEPILAGLNAPILDEVRKEGASRAYRKPLQEIKLADASRVAVAQLAPGTDWQEINFSQPVTGRYLALEVLSAQDDQAYATLAELEAVGSDGVNIQRTNWKTAFANSEELEAENGSADNLFDLQPTTYWHTRWQGTAPKHPHLVVLDLGSSQTLTGLRLQPRQDMANGRIKDCRVYLSKEPFSGQ